MPKQDDSKIADAAYHLWLNEGQPEGRDKEHWLRARSEIEAAAPKKRRAAAKPKAEAATPKPRKKATAKPRKAAS